MYTLEEDLTLCEKLKINVSQLMFMRLLVPDLSLPKDMQIAGMRKITGRFQAIGGISLEDITDLVNRKLIIDNDPDADYVLYCQFEVFPKYMKHFGKNIANLADELVDAYPYELDGGKGTFTAKNATAEEISDLYSKAINNDPDEHKRVLSDLKWAVDNKMLKVGLRKFVGTKFWVHIRAIKTTETKGGFDGEIG
jgi:hypothetical protein